MPELPDVELYLHCLRPRVVGRRVERVRIASPSVLRTFDPPIDDVEGLVVHEARRLGKRLVLALDGDLFLVIHLMIAGRLRWYDTGGKDPPSRPKIGHLSLTFPNGTLWLTEAGTKKRATAHVVRGAAALAGHDRGGLEVHEIDLDAFTGRLRSESHTVKRALCDPRLFSGIGNAYSDEILHRARLSPLALTGKLTDEQVAELFDATRSTLADWRDRLIADIGDDFPGPGQVTAFRPDMAVHGRFGEPCPECGTSVQRIVYANRETNYCPTCQTAGRVLADRSLSRLLKNEWPRTVEEMEEG
ncbi:MAG: formamidopyrimidine-DNA glycosylase [Planctomycetes bacterium]|nr:formamidopyrimidine-DNA glycosylase [Planctomycetota bacterium]